MTQPLSPVTPPPWQRRLYQRASAIVLKPQSTWRAIDGEAASIRALFVFYVLPLAAIGPVAGFLGGQIFGRGVGVLGTVYRPSFFNALSMAVIQYVFAVLAVAALGVIIQALARQFGAAPDQIQAFKVAIYGSTAAWLAGVFLIFPPLSILSLVGFYSLYLIYTGLPKLMKAPDDKALIYGIVTLICAVLIWVITGALGAALTPRAVI
ncbi:MAG: YIP1 family protein [Oceanicaulis sp.]|nr:YIP1 family protein [Oceanicaulis sp.]